MDITANIPISGGGKSIPYNGSCTTNFSTSGDLGIYYMNGI